MSAKNWSFSYKKAKKEEVKQNIIDSISLWTSIGFLWYAFFSIIGDYFKEYLSVDGGVLFVMVFVLWLGYEWPKKYLKKMTIFCHLVPILIPVGYIILHLEEILDGIVRMAWFYLPYFNDYYNSSFYLGIASKNENVLYAFTALCMILWYLCWTIAYGWKKRVLLVLFPFLALVLELVVGLSPAGNGLFWAFFGAILLVTMEGTSIIKRIIALACVWGVVLLSGFLFQEKMDETEIRRQKQALLKWQNSIDLENINLANLFQFDFHFNWERLDNDTPQYTGKTILEIETESRPVGNIYLKGFYGTNYENGDWRWDDSFFQEACKKAGKSPEDVAKQIFQMPFDRMKAAYLDMQKVNYQLFYVGATGDVAYVPYVSEYAALDNAYTLVGDYLLKKSIFDNVTSGEIYGGGFQYIGNGNVINTAIEAGFGNYSFPYSDNDLVIDLSQQKEELDFLNSLSKAYLQLPEDTEYLDLAVNKIQKEMDAYEEGLNSGYIGHYGVGLENENYRRIIYASEVQNYLKEQMGYSLKLDSLPADMDPIEYALTVSHEGYCMHFASAATLILRKLGVPARYVSGYTVETSAFVTDAETGVFKASVGDFMAHAWVEIYLDNIGWTILEATPGSSLDNLPSQEDINRWDSLAETKRPKDDPEGEDTESEESENSEEPTEDTQDSQTQPDESQNSQQQTQSQSEDEDTSDENGVGNGGNHTSLGTMLKAFGIIGIIVLVVLGIAFGVKYGANRYEGVLYQEIEKKMTKKAVKRINRRMYYLLRLKNPNLWFAKKLSDKEYEKALIEAYPAVSESEWKQFMEIVKKNHYSKEKITVEEMQYCYECYKNKEKK